MFAVKQGGFFVDGEDHDIPSYMADCPSYTLSSVYMISKMKKLWHEFNPKSIEALYPLVSDANFRPSTFTNAQMEPFPKCEQYHSVWPSWESNGWYVACTECGIPPFLMYIQECLSGKRTAEDLVEAKSKWNKDSMDRSTAEMINSLDKMTHITTCSIAAL